MRLYSSVIMALEIAPQDFSPSFSTREVEGKSYTIVDEWCSGFLQGIRLTQEAWQPLLDEQPVLRPFQLFATPEGWGELAAAPDEPAMDAEWSSMIAPTVHAPFTLTGYRIAKRPPHPCLHGGPNQSPRSREQDATRLVRAAAGRNTKSAFAWRPRMAPGATLESRAR